MHLDELQWFVVLAETEHVTDAAAELGVSQPTLSRALARLEDQLGAPLFDRVNRRLHLNAYGQILLEHARRSIAEIRSATERIAALRDPDTGTVRLAFLHSQASWFVPDLLRRFRAEAPRVQFDLVQGAAHVIVEQLANGQADLAITSPRPDGYRWRGLYLERLCLAVPRDHRLASRARIRLADAAGEPFVALAPGFGLRQLTDELCAEAGIAPQVVFEAMEIPTMEGLVAAGFGVAVVPVPRPERAEPGAVYVPLAAASAKRQLGLAWSAERQLPPAAQRFADFVIRQTYEDK
ncbi:MULTISPECIES: LysR family transcriptional regulator [Mycolicibacterium]|uniref:LysR family transcriptional regulator n=1 Tax=Mycolicibacterium mageritense TaxID=53462 RepID=A0ABN5Y466_MYCME|nr:LysR family transcriptional regulator [Mycolicibacterium mageritense]OKH63452.1 LysR family transcriptional regulator [Mycobacterium sp. SWH-M3]BBX32943.1 LysR family transcriptional regulator [Mycolicibacterium mageritense]CDO21376.1 LysR family transcriptional regulator [Mycolicibacterium mageritense DSM 44476 = CIP 104973]